MNSKNFMDLNSESIKDLIIKTRITPITKEVYEISLEQTSFGFQKNSKPLAFDANALDENIPNITYLFGQLQSIHERLHVLDLKDILKKYNGTFWSKEKTTPVYLLHLAIAAGLILPPQSTSKQCLIMQEIYPTISPNDPNFQSWYEQNKSKILKKKGGQEPADD